MWLEKIGAIEPFSGNLATCYNNINEEEALEWYKILTDKSVVFPKFQILNKNNLNGDGWLGASPDGVVEENVYGLPSEGVLEIKCPFFDGDINKAFPWKRIPLYCMPQAQGLMEILDRDWMDLYVWTPNGSSLFRLYRDVEYWDAIKTALDDFWWNHVQPAKELYNKSKFTDPLTQLRLLKSDIAFSLIDHCYCLEPMMAREVSLASDGLIAPIYISLSIIVHTLENPSINVPLMARPLPVCHLVLESEVYFQEDAGIHVMNMYMGVPQQLLYGIFDTGSAVTWFQCEKCASEVKYPCFNKTKSFSYSTIRCDDKQKCNTKYGYIKGCDELQSSCEFNLTYGDGSNAYGEMATEYTTFDWSRGASNNEYAITKQLYPDEPKFSYCISSDYDTINLLIFGPKANLKGQAIKMLKNALYDFYYIDVLGIKLNGERLAVTPSVFQMSDSGTRGFIIDSGTTLTFLALDAFEALKKKVEELLGPPTKYMIFEVCYDSGTFGKWWPGKTRPIIGLEFENSLFEFEESLLWENIPNSNDLECLQIVRSDVLISFLGSQLLLDVNVGHDPNNNLLKWLTWFQCNNLAYKSKFPWFNQTQSVTYSTIRCSNKQLCDTGAYGAIRGCDDLGDICEFKVTYQDGTNAYGEMATEDVTFDWPKDHVLVQYMFGCSWDNSIKLMGIIGASNNKYSLPKQLYADDPKFSYCISSDLKATNAVMFGPDANLKGDVANMFLNGYYDYYYIDVYGIKVNGEHLAV
uniref:Peptidase A1 domain-containing protein n=1 Tax=Chenopodium quinoa TaxID=63459 RepID=A0A803L7V8_CHEQI